MAKDNTQKTMEDLIKERTEKIKKLAEVEGEVDKIRGEIKRLNEEIEQAGINEQESSEIQLSEVVGGFEMGRDMVTGMMDEWMQYTGLDIEVVDTERDGWQNNGDTLVIAVKVPKSATEKIKEQAASEDEINKTIWLVETLGEKIKADEIQTEVTEKGGETKVVARFWWD